ncbi:MAG: mechanosensitive ion channel domain-containing protein [Bacteroidota bacterium]
MEEWLGHLLYDYFVKLGMVEDWARALNMATLLILVVIIAILLDFISWRILRGLSVGLARRTKTNFDNFLVTNRVPRYLAHIIPLLLLWEFLPVIFTDYEYLENIAVKVVQIISIVLILQIVKKSLRSLNDYLKTLPRFRDKPIDSYIQVFMIFAWVIGILTVFAVITETTIWKFFTALGAASAIILLIFRDTILGFVASIQVSINDMVRIGDWITFDKYGADGDVIEINLATVKVQNFDKTITTIPTYALISDSFKNWRGMQKSGGRRIKRALIIRQNSIRFLSPQEVQDLKKIQLVSNYLDDRSTKIDAYNQENEIDKTLLLNGRNLTNIGLFRKYIETYLENHSALNKEMIMMSRQLNPTSQGIPLEIYAFSADKRWQNYEYIMADIFDHLLAAVPYFGLELFELPSKIGTGKES